MPTANVPIQWMEGLAGSHSQSRTHRSLNMGKGNNSQKNDKKNKKPKQDKTKTAVKK
jgi:hypothetical protein